MSAARTRYVVVFRRWVSRGKSGRWVTQVGAMSADSTSWDARLRLDDTGTIGVFAVDGARTDAEAVGVLAEWLVKGRPLGMTVREVGR